MANTLIIPNSDFSNVALKQVQFSDKIEIYTRSIPSDAGIVSGSGLYNINEEVTLTATPNEIYTFDKWSDGNTDNPRTILVQEPKLFSAKFKIVYNENSFTWGKGGVAKAGTSSGSTNATMSIIFSGTNTSKALCKAVTDVMFISSNGYKIFAAVDSPINYTLSSSGVVTYYTIYNPLIDSLTIQAGHYFEISLQRTSGEDADITEGYKSLLVNGTWEWES